MESNKTFIYSSIPIYVTDELNKMMLLLNFKMPIAIETKKITALILKGGDIYKRALKINYISYKALKML